MTLNQVTGVGTATQAKVCNFHDEQEIEFYCIKCDRNIRRNDDFNIALRTQMFNETPT